MKPSLRLVISFITGLSTLVVASVVIAIASTLYPSITTELGKKYAVQLGRTAGFKIADYLQEQTSIAVSAAASMSQLPYLPLPSEDPRIDVDTLCPIHVSVLMNANFSIASLGLIMGDGSSSGANIQTLPNGTRVVRCTSLNTYNASITGRAILTETTIDIDRRIRLDDKALFAPTFDVPPGTAMVPAYDFVKNLVMADLYNIWYTYPAAYRRDINATPTFIYPAVSAVMNSSGHFLGWIGIIINLEQLTNQLRSFEIDNRIAGDASSYSMIVDATSIILVSTNPAPIANIYLQPGTAAVPRGCLSSNDQGYLSVNGVICPIKPVNYGYLPLREFASTIKPSYFQKPYDFSEEMHIGGDRLQVTGMKLKNTARAFEMCVLSFFSFETLDASITRTTSAAAGIGVGIFVVGVLVSILVVILILKPLEIVTEKMDATSELKLTNQDQQRKKDLSVISEIYALQVAYAYMHNSFEAFSKYVAKDIVKSLVSLARHNNDVHNMQTDQINNNNNQQNQDDVMMMAKQKNDIQKKSLLSVTPSLTPSFSTILLCDIKGMSEMLVRLFRQNDNNDEIPSANNTLQQGERVANSRRRSSANNSTRNASLVEKEFSRSLRTYFEHMLPIVSGHEGTVVQFLGDAIVSAWGSASNHGVCEYQEVKACIAALLMARETRLTALNRAFPEKLCEGIDLKIGVASGAVLSGPIGCRDRLSYAVVGHAVEAASVLESANKEYATTILVSGGVAEAVRPYFLVRNMGYVDLALNDAVRRRYLMKRYYPEQKNNNNNNQMNESNNLTKANHVQPQPQQQVFVMTEGAKFKHPRASSSPLLPNAANSGVELGGSSVPFQHSSSSPPSSLATQSQQQQHQNQNQNQTVTNSALRTIVATEMLSGGPPLASSDHHDTSNFFPTRKGSAIMHNNSNNNNNRSNDNAFDLKQNHLNQDDESTEKEDEEEITALLAVGEKLFELVGLLPLEDVDLGSLKEQKYKRTSNGIVGFSSLASNYLQTQTHHGGVVPEHQDDNKTISTTANTTKKQLNNNNKLETARGLLGASALRKRNNNNNNDQDDSTSNSGSVNQVEREKIYDEQGDDDDEEEEEENEEGAVENTKNVEGGSKNRKVKKNKKNADISSPTENKNNNNNNVATDATNKKPRVPKRRFLEKYQKDQEIYRSHLARSVSSASSSSRSSASDQPQRSWRSTSQDQMRGTRHHFANHNGVSVEMGSQESADVEMDSNNNSRRFRINFADSGSGTDDEVASNFTSALKKKYGQTAVARRRRRHHAPRIRLTSAALLETAVRSTMEIQSIVATDEEIEFVTAFNGLVENEGCYLNPQDFALRSNQNGNNSDPNTDRYDVPGAEEGMTEESSAQQQQPPRSTSLPIHLRFPVFFSPPRVVNFLFNNHSNNSTLLQQRNIVINNNNNNNNNDNNNPSPSFVIRPTRADMEELMKQHIGTSRCSASFMMSSEIALFRICGIFSSSK